MNVIYQAVKTNKIIAIIRGVAEDKILKTAQALYKGGIRMIEVTFNQSSLTCNQDTAKAISMLSENFGEKAYIGAGTVMTKEQVEAAVGAGAKYIISPNFNKKIVEETRRLGAISMPGVFTPSEISNAYESGADFVKVFPAGELGINYLKAIRGPISHIPMLAVGGIGLQNINAFLETGIEGVGIGSCLVNLNLINENKYDEISALAKAFVDKIEG